MLKNNRYTLYFLLLIFSNSLFFSCKENVNDQKNTANNENVTVKDTVWSKADEIIANIQVPTFKDQSFSILDYGAVADGETLNTKAFKEAIDACAEAGGGKVIVPEGKFLTGAIHLKSNVNLHLKEGSEVLFSKEKKDFLPVVHTSYEGVELMNY